MDGLRKITKEVSQNSRHPSRDPKVVTSNYSHVSYSLSENCLNFYIGTDDTEENTSYTLNTETVLLRTVGTQIPDYTVSYPRRL